MTQREKRRKYTIYLSLAMLLFNALKEEEKVNSAIWSRLDALEDRALGLLEMIPGEMVYDDIDDAVKVSETVDRKVKALAKGRAKT